MMIAKSDAVDARRCTLTMLIEDQMKMSSKITPNKDAEHRKK